MRPQLNLKLNSEEFINYYWLKEELYNFCKACGIPGSGSKKELTERIYEYLKSGKVIHPQKKTIHKTSAGDLPLTIDSVIPESYKNDERHRAFLNP